MTYFFASLHSVKEARNVARQVLFVKRSTVNKSFEKKLDIVLHGIYFLRRF